MAVMMSPMAFGAPGSTSNKSAMVPVVYIVFYPVLIGLLYYLLNWPFLAIPPRIFLLLSIALPTAAFMLFGYPRIMLNMYRGVASIGYCKKESAAYYNGSPLKAADAASFTIIDSSYARDRTHVYYDGKPMQGADPASFAPILTRTEQSAFWRDAKHVFNRGHLIAAADPTTFEVLPGSGYARDRSRAYFHDKMIDGADGATFALLNPSFARDKARLYFLGGPILANADVASFELLYGADYGRDANKVYALPNALFATAHELEGADRATFEPLSRAYAKDAKHVYFADEGHVSVLGADPASFTVTEWDEATKSEARDKQHFYAQGKIVTAQ